MAQESLSKFIYDNHHYLKGLIFCLYYGIGCAFYCKVEGWSVLNTAYYLTVTYTSVGYGYFAPSTEQSRAFTIFTILIGTTVIMYIVSECSRGIILEAVEQFTIWLQRLRGIREEDFDEKTRRKHKLFLCICLIFLAGLVGSLFYMGNEGWTYLDAVYWVVATMTTVGYGDFVLQYDSTRIFGILFLTICVALYSTLVGLILEMWAQSIEEKALSKVNELNVTSRDRFNSDWLAKMMEVVDKSPNGVMSRERFILEVLKEEGKISWKRDIEPLYEEYKEVIRDNDAKVMTKSELERFVNRRDARTFGLKNEIYDSTKSPLHHVGMVVVADADVEDV